jgi:hypothetical protein
MKTSVKTVTKNELREFDYFKSDVLFNDMEKNKRKILLENAYRMGTEIQARKARIIFACSGGIKKIEARITALSKTSVTLNGFHLPVKCVIGVDVV